MRGDRTGLSRREFLQSMTTAGVSLFAGVSAADASRSKCRTRRCRRRCCCPAHGFSISLAEWSLHRALFGRAGKKIDHLDFSTIARNDYSIDAVEYVNQFWKDKARDTAYVAELNRRAANAGVRQLLIMIDGEGRLGDPDAKLRSQAVENHYQWADAAKALGCHSIRVNAASAGSYDEQKKLAADGLSRLSEYAGKLGLNVIVENHGGLSSNGKWLASVLAAVNMSNCGSLPDFGNFRVSDKEEYDRYKGVAELMPFAKAVSAKSHDFDENGNESHTDYFRMMEIVLDAGYHGYVGIEYEGNKLSEPDGIWATKRLLERVRDAL